MNAQSHIDITFDFRLETPGYPKTDPERVSPTLRRYHELLWSKPLPGTVLRAVEIRRNRLSEVSRVVRLSGLDPIILQPRKRLPCRLIVPGGRFCHPSRPNPVGSRSSPWT
jgi:hypothetical protein